MLFSTVFCGSVHGAKHKKNRININFSDTYAVSCFSISQKKIVLSFSHFYPPFDVMFYIPPQNLPECIGLTNSIIRTSDFFVCVNIFRYNLASPFFWILHLSNISTRDCISAILAFTGASGADPCCSVAFFAYNVNKACFTVFSARKNHARQALLLQSAVTEHSFFEKLLKLGKYLERRFSGLLCKLIDCHRAVNIAHKD